MSRAHAILSASGAKRWLACPPSARLEEQFEDQGSAYAEEGTLAHAVAEARLSLLYVNRSAQADHATNKLLERLEASPLYNEEMDQAIQAYVELVNRRVDEARANCPGAIVEIEQWLDFSRFVPEGFGTGDVVIVADGTIEVIDLKYGKGVPVDVEMNPQLMLYGVGAIEGWSDLYDIRKVRLTVFQPRLDALGTIEYDADWLLRWAEAVVKPLAMKADRGEGEFFAGDHCRFCKARHTCRARADQVMELAKKEFRDPPLLTDEEVAHVLRRAELLQAWVSDVQEYALTQARDNGRKWPGYKLVEGRSIRKYSDEEAVAKALVSAGYDEAILFRRALLGIAELEKVVGKKAFGTILGDLVVKPAGKPVLVPEDDKRPAIDAADSLKQAFAE